MTDKLLKPIDRRALLGGLATTLLLPSRLVHAQTRPTLALEAVAGTMVLKEGQTPTPIWQLAGGPTAEPLRFKRGETVDVTLTNRVPIPVALTWSGLDGHPSAEAMTGVPALAPQANATYAITFRHAGTMLADLLFSGDTAARPTIGRPVVISETEPLAIDRDEVLLFQEWRVKPDGNAVAPGTDPGEAATIFTVNGADRYDLTVAQNDRLRVRLINSRQRTVIAIRIADADVRVMAIDGQPSEPFLARDGLIVLTPGSRVDALIDATMISGKRATITLLDGRQARPIGAIMVSNATPARLAPLPMPAALPTNGLPAQFDLKSALRIEIPLGTPDWLALSALTATTQPAFKVKRGRVVVLTVTNRGAKPAGFHLHGHHFRLLDRLDDGWKPYWLDTLAIDAGQTQRIAFAAEFSGLYPMEAIETVWASPRKVRSYLVE